MDLVLMLKALVMGVIALLMLFILVLMIRAAFSSRPRPSPPKTPSAPRACGGKRDGALCGKRLYRCSNCLEEGCQMEACVNRGFKAPGDCLRCGFGATMEPV